LTHKLSTRYLAATVQAAPVYLDKTATIDKSINLIERAAAQGAKLIAFPELWCPGYPWWVWLGSPAWGRQFLVPYIDHSITRDGPELRRIAEAARCYAITVVFGYSERDGGSLYISQSIFGEDGRALVHRRKLKPARMERHVFGQGGGADLTVVQTDVGRLGALCCGEHFQPLLKCAMFSLQEQVHVASWPSFSMLRGKAFRTGPEAATLASQMYAVEGQCFTLVATMVADQRMLDTVCDTPERRSIMSMPDMATCGGRSMIFSPDGEPLADYMPEGEEGLVIAEIDLSDIELAKTSADTLGHWSRPDVVQLKVDFRSHPVVAVDKTEQPSHIGERA
jgi:aliphatic nitrilase